MSSRGAGQRLASLVPEFAEFFMDRLRISVEDSLRRVVNQADKKLRRTVNSLGRREVTTLATLVAESLTEKELDLLARDTLDLPLDSFGSPNDGLAARVAAMLRGAERVGALDRLLVRFARSLGTNSVTEFVRKLFVDRGMTRTL